MRFRSLAEMVLLLREGPWILAATDRAGVVMNDSTLTTGCPDAYPHPAYITYKDIHPYYRSISHGRTGICLMGPMCFFWLRLC